MELQKETMRLNNMSLPHPKTLDLKGRQSVRATFKLSTKAIEALAIVAAQLGIKQKSIFDHLVEDAQSLMMIAREIDSASLKDLERIQKTFVISRKSLKSIERTAKKANASRDALVEMSIQRLMPIISRERERHGIRKRILNDIGNFLDKGLELLAELETDLGNDDPTTINFKNAIKALASAQSEISAFVDKGAIIENFELPRCAVKAKQRNDLGNDLDNHT